MPSTKKGLAIIRGLRGLVLAGAVLAIAGGVAYGAIPTADGKIYACFDKVSGQARLYDPATNLPKACGPKETSVIWNAAGPAGQDGEDGQNGQNGQDGQDGQDGIAGFETVYEESALNSSGSKTVFVTCPSGKVAIGGGGGVYGEWVGEGQVIVQGVGLVQDQPFNDYGWAARADEFVATDLPWQLGVWVRCADVN